LEIRLLEADWRGVRAVILSEAKDLCAHREGKGLDNYCHPALFLIFAFTALRHPPGYTSSHLSYNQYTGWMEA
jgi:hypothetical protein